MSVLLDGVSWIGINDVGGGSEEAKVSVGVVVTWCGKCEATEAMVKVWVK